ncbi:cyclopropane-fatty-acyl-phospholipid synthase [Gemmobacter aquarius]|uniref:Cyclopropane-fatty-acyl-phospholipid synthase n=1 Tax=Paragemmobacter aquarius TaxID=2169400 RepID=A0A2S0UQ95_9RHOB|nr:FAD-dependent oxidoreductase [Gemmobacter aquarius]AWB49940.1 cyclopropane-fatty-acyl-phospholipid synthase [Gemmobacter aquarius]
MPFETLGAVPRRVAVIGGGISGMAAAHLLADSDSVVLFEAEGRLGGHARTKMGGKNGDQPVDTGFIVFNKVNYPNLLGMFDKLDVPYVESSMSFGASVHGGRVEYGLASLDALFAQRKNALSPRFLGMIRDIMRFNKRALAIATAGMTIGELLRALGTGAWFRDYYITPFSGAIWSTPTRGILDFPAEALVRFFQNHHLLDFEGQHQWYTVKGGSIEYVRRLQASLVSRGVDIRLGAPIAAVKREAGTVLVRAQGGEWELFDDVIFATHSDVTLRLLADATPAEAKALGAVRYQANEAVLHRDPSVMPKNKKCWSSWVYVEPAAGASGKIDLTYWMNSLQPIPMEDPIFVTLNSNGGIRDELVDDVVSFDHPVYDLAAIEAQETIRKMNGTLNTWFAGAWMRNGFHEDGFASALDVVEAMRSGARERQMAA